MYCFCYDLYQAQTIENKGSAVIILHARVVIDGLSSLYFHQSLCIIVNNLQNKKNTQLYEICS